MRIVDLLVNRIGYAVVSSIKTLNFTRRDDSVQSKMIICLKKSEEFDRLYDEFEAKVAINRKRPDHEEEAKAG
jgi:hypothetical protein